MPNGYPCPSCGDANAPLFARDVMYTGEVADPSHAAASAPYACAACFAAAGVPRAGNFVASADVTSTNHPEA
jgi:hypothetical protein